MSQRDDPRVGAALTCFGVQLASAIWMFVVFPGPLVWIVVWSVVAITTVVCTVMVRAPVAQFFFALTVPFALWLVSVYIKALNGAPMDFYGLFFVYAVLPLLFISGFGLIAALAAPKSYKSPYF